ncbi:phosphate ABC transporter permease subunit PstC [Facklamia miroungae]|uniref:Phosphate transport system permease protein n=1 Tax=Facklamia miroungae TaxID=120956 RepID=A0A1G7SGE8_9LACT|nr:phosphate ABC transporter permease subunit PstC [Facklamia miroungae]NKZ29664.1 phosphate ABC transporter permease subunit PstC [Facklamia miroungae]SDG21974.1 phosphate transport system permease protein [Facklamia miroungae]
MQGKALERFMKYVFMFCAFLSILSIVLIFYFIFIGGTVNEGVWKFQGGIPFLMKQGFFKTFVGQQWQPSWKEPLYGIFPFIMGSIYVTIGAIIVGVPIGVLTAIFMAYFCPASLYRLFKPAINLMAAIPSIVYGFFALQMMVPFIRGLKFLPANNGMNILTASVLLGVMILPTIIGLSEAAIRAVPKHYYNASMGLGATHERSVLSVVVPAAKSGILSAIILGIGRAIGETMAVVLIAGNQPRLATSLLDGTRTLTTNIVLEMGYASGDHQHALIMTASVLFIFILIINSIFMWVKSKGDRN